MMKTTLLAAAILAAAAFAAPARAQNLLDQQLGPAAPTAPTAAPTAPVKPGDVKPDPTVKPAPAPGGSDISSPDAVKAVDDQDLITKLTHPDDKPNPDQVAQQMKDALDRMDQVKTLLSDKKDPGQVTQETERRIMVDLDAVIEFARQQQQQQQQSSSQQQQQQGQKRQPSQGNQQQPGPGQNQGGNTAAPMDKLPGGGQATPDPLEPLRNTGASEWGDLRATERDLISHGAREDYVSSYRDMINRYYQALGDLGKTRTH